MRRVVILGGVLLVGGLSLVGVASQQTERVLEVEQLADNLYVLRGGGGNSAAFVTTSGVVLVDTKNPGWGQPLIDKIRELTPNPVTTIINTHTHGDHVSGNVEFPASVDFVAHENTQRLQREMNPVTGLGRPPAPNIFDAHGGNGIAEQTFSETLTLGSGADRVELHYFGRAHTGGDAWVVFPALRVMHSGDAFPGKQVPIMDANNGGSGVDYPDTVRKGYEGVPDADRIITGHSTVMSRGDLQEFAEFLDAFVSDVRDSKAAGRSAADVAASWQIPARFEGFSKPAADRLEAYVQVIYDELE